MRASILPTDCQRCGRSRPPSSLTWTIEGVDHDRPGQHWVAFYIDEHGTGTYFDSYGLPPLDSRFLLRLRRNSTTYRWNTTQLQGMLSQTCGQYCCVFLYFMCKGYNLNQFLNLFDNDYVRNDYLIVKLFRKIFLPSKYAVTFNRVLLKAKHERNTSYEKSIFM